MVIHFRWKETLRKETLWVGVFVSGGQVILCQWPIHLVACAYPYAPSVHGVRRCKGMRSKETLSSLSILLLPYGCALCIYALEPKVGARGWSTRSKHRQKDKGITNALTTKNRRKTTLGSVYLPLLPVLFALSPWKTEGKLPSDQ